MVDVELIDVLENDVEMKDFKVLYKGVNITSKIALLKVVREYLKLSKTEKIASVSSKIVDKK